jgi:beta-fructofuranosidase
MNKAVAPVDVSIEAALRSLDRAAPKAARDPSRPVYHFRPPAMWMNDLNGGLFHDGWYHMFYLHDPFGADGLSRAPLVEEHLPLEDVAKPNRCWGHARSRDLVRWEHLPPAIVPAREFGQLKPISGSATISPGGDPTIFYTSVDLQGRREHWAAVGDKDLVHWRPHPANPMLTAGGQGAPRFNDRWRDCFVFAAGGRSFLILGAELADCGEAVVPIFESTRRDLADWEYRGVLFRKPQDELAYFECPKFFPLEGNWVLVTSPYDPVRYFVGDFDLDSLVFTEKSGGLIDLSSEHYASENITDIDGRVWLFGWMPGWHSEKNNGEWWNGCMSLPRSLSLDDELVLRQRPAPPLATLRRRHSEQREVSARDGRVVLGVRGQEMEIAASVDPGSASQCALTVGCSPEGEGGIRIAIVDDKSRRIEVDGVSGPVLKDSPVDLRIFVDRSIVEVFADDGRVCCGRKMTTYDPNWDHVVFSSQGGTALLRSLESWQLAPIW